MNLSFIKYIYIYIYIYLVIPNSKSAQPRYYINNTTGISKLIKIRYTNEHDYTSPFKNR